MPRASTSAYTLDSPGFRKSTPRRAAAQRASTSIASTSAQLLQTAIELNGKGKERAATQDGGGPFETAPKLARGRTGREGKRGTEDQQEKPSKRRKVTADRPSDAPVLQDTGSQPSITTKELTPARRRSSQDDGASRPLRKKRTKKHVRIAQHAAADPSDGETSAYQPSAASDSDSDDAVVSRPIGRALANSTAAALAAPDDSIDWADPLSIPTAQPLRSRRYWQWLELGICTSAVHDVARDESHLGRTLVEWELLRQHRASEEALARTAQPREDEEGQNGSLRAGSAALDTPNGSRVGTPDPPAEEEKDEQDDATPRPTKRPRRRRADISLPSHDPNRALTPFPITRASAEQLEVDEDGVNLLPLPSAVALAKMARWPVHSSLVQPPSEEEGEVEVAQPDALEEALLAQYERFARLRNAATLPALAPPRTARAPSAYAPGGPFERRQDAEMQDDSGTGPDSDSSDELDNLENDDDLLLEPESLPRSMTSIPPTIDKVLLRLLDLVPKAPLPAYDYWTQKTRTEELLKDDKRRGFVRDECAPGWEEVLAIAREMELPAHVVDELETQLVSLFGAPSRGTTRRLPSPGLADKFVVRVHPRSSKAADAQQDDDDEGPTSPAPSSAAGDADFETANRRSARSTPALRTSTSLGPFSSDAARASDSVEDEHAAPRARGGRRGPPRDRSAAAGAPPQPQRVYKPYVYSEAQRARKAAYKRDRRRREKEQRDAASAGEAAAPSISAPTGAEAVAALVTE